MKGSEDEHHRLIELIYEAPLNDDWQPVVEQLSEMMDRVHVHIFGHDTRTQTLMALQCNMYDPDQLSLYDRYYHERNAWLPGVARSKVGVATSSDNYIPTDELKKTEFYNDWIRPQEDIGAGGGIVLFNDGDRFVILGGNIRLREQEAKQQQWIDLLDRISGHLRRAFRLRGALATAETTMQAYRQSLDGAGYAVFLIDGDGQLVHRHAAADAMIASGSLLWIGPSNTLRAFDATANETIQTRLRAVKAGLVASLSETFPVCSKDTPAVGMSASPGASSVKSVFDAVTAE